MFVVLWHPVLGSIPRQIIFTERKAHQQHGKQPENIMNTNTENQPEDAKPDSEANAVGCSDLLACPFCGGEALPPDDEQDDIICKGCATTFSSFFHEAGKSQQETVRKWNTRIGSEYFQNLATTWRRKAKQMDDMKHDSPKSAEWESANKRLSIKAGTYRALAREVELTISDIS